jgi:hypothetical protein
VLHLPGEAQKGDGMTPKRKLAPGLLAFAVGNLSLTAALANRLAFPFASVEFTKGFFIGFSIVMNATALVLLIGAVHAQRGQASPLVREAK